MEENWNDHIIPLKAPTQEELIKYIEFLKAREKFNKSVAFIKAVDILRFEGSSDILSITAFAEVKSSGWKNGQLNPIEYTSKPVDGIYDFTFTADGPSNDIRIQPVGDIGANYLWIKAPEEMKGVRIQGENNSLLAMLVNARVLK